jgi:cob(I)alamin adenosyltransferase
MAGGTAHEGAMGATTRPRAKKSRGLIAVNTGDGKGKTTAALGTALRAIGYGKRVCVIQFIKGDWHYGELDAARRLEPELEWHRAGLGFYRIMGDDRPEADHRRAAAEGLALARDKIRSGDYLLVILDEINNAVAEGLLAVDDVLEALRGKPDHVHVFLTGRGAHPRILEIADLVTEMREVKHPFREGLLAQKGFDY